MWGGVQQVSACEAARLLCLDELRFCLNVSFCISIQLKAGTAGVPTILCRPLGSPQDGVPLPCVCRGVWLQSGVVLSC